MASKAQTFVANPNWTKAQTAGWYRVQEALPIALTYLAEEIPVLDNHTDEQLVDEVGVLKQAKKTVEKAEKAHVERLKARMGDKDSLRGQTYEAAYRGGKRVILNQEACKETIDAFDEAGVHLKRLLASIKSGQLVLPENTLLQLKRDAVPPETPVDMIPMETNRDSFFTTAQGGRSLYVEPIE